MSEIVLKMKSPMTAEEIAAEFWASVGIEIAPEKIRVVRTSGPIIAFIPLKSAAMADFCNRNLLERMPAATHFEERKKHSELRSVKRTSTTYEFSR